MPNAREIAYISLEKCEKQKSYSNIEIDSQAKRNELKGAEKGLYVSLVYGVLERRLTLDFIISCISSRPLNKLDSAVIIPLRIGLYQLIFMDKIPDSAAVDESVKVCIKHSSKSLGGFVNAILRSFIRAVNIENRKNPEKIFENEPFRTKYQALDKFEKMSVIYSYPVWLCKHFCTAYSEDAGKKIMEAQNDNKSTTLRINTLKADRESILEILKAKNINAKKTKFSPFGIITEGGSVSELGELFESGVIFVQDEASQLASIVLDAGENETIIDTCACPGGKSFSSAILMNNKGKIISCDLHESKLSLITKTAGHLGINIIETSAKDSSKYDKNLANAKEGGADRVLCDVPCSGLGVIAKKPEVRYKNPQDIERLPEIQRKILNNCAEYVRCGGTLVYSTCTLNPRENENNVISFLNENPDFEPFDFSLSSEDGESIGSEKGMISLFPHIHNTDGFFIARMKKIK